MKFNTWRGMAHVLYTSALVAFLAMNACAMAATSLIDEVFALPKPEPHRSIRVEHIVQKYIPIGTTRAQAIRVLK